jgi:hypothetical protein
MALLGSLLVLLAFSQAVLAAERIVEFTVPGCG